MAVLDTLLKPLSWVREKFFSTEPVIPKQSSNLSGTGLSLEYSLTPAPRRTQGMVAMLDGDTFLKFPPFALTYAQMFYLAEVCPVFRGCLQTLNTYTFKQGLIWKPAYTSQCPTCGRKYTGDVPLDRCPTCDEDEDDFYSILGRIANNESESEVQSKILDMTSPKTKLTYPNPDEFEAARMFFRHCNQAGQTFVDVLKLINSDTNIVDDGYLIVRKEYKISEDGDILSARPYELVRGSPQLIRKVIDAFNNIGGRWWKCLRDGTIVENDNWHADRLRVRRVEDIKRIKIDPHTKPKCPHCNANMHDIHYFEMMNEAGDIEAFYIENEIIHDQKWMPSTGYGRPSVLTLYPLISTLTHQTFYMRDWAMQKKTAPGIISVTTANAASFRRQWKEEEKKRETDKTYIPVMLTEPEGTGFGGSGGVKWVPLFQTPQEMQLIEFRNEARARVESFMGISADIHTGVGEKAGLSERERKTVEAEQMRINKNILQKLIPMFDIKDWKCELAPSEESGVFLAEQIKQIQLQNAQMWHTLGFEVDKDANGEIRIWKPPLSKEQLGMLTQLIQMKAQLEAQKDQLLSGGMGPPGAPGSKPGNTAGGETKMQSYQPRSEKSPTGNPLAGKQAELSRGITKEVKDCELCDLDLPTWEVIRKACEEDWVIEKNVEKRGDKYCVVHGHAQKEGSDTDKPKGSVIKCFDNAKDAYAMHSAIVHSQERQKEVKKGLSLQDWMINTWKGGAIEKMIKQYNIETTIGQLAEDQFFWVVYYPWGEVYDDGIAPTEDEARSLVSHHMSDLVEELGKVNKADGESGSFQMNRSQRAEGRTNTDIDQVSRSGSTYTPGAMGDYTCKYCGKVFKSKEELGGHVRTCSQNPEKKPQSGMKDQPMDVAGIEGELKRVELALNALLVSLTNSHYPTAMVSPPSP